MNQLRGAILAVGMACALSGCNPSDAGTANHPATGPHSGVLRMAGTQQPDNLNTLLGTQIVDEDIALFWGSFLFLWNDRDQIVSELATTVPTIENGGVSKDGRTITYHLRSGVRWQDGAPFTAADVVYSWRQVMNPRNDVGSRQGYELISKIDAPDQQTLIIHLKQKYAPFVATFFTMSASGYLILPKHLLDKYSNINNVAYNRLPVGTGPFKVVANSGNEIKLEANPHYWRGTPKLKVIVFRYIPSDKRILDLVKSHEIDFYENASQALEPRLHNIGDTTVYLYPFTRWTDLGFNLSRPKLADRRVRQALAYAIDRNRLIQHVTHGVNFPADSDQPPSFWAHNNHLRRYAYSPPTSAHLLDAAGWRMGPHGVRQKHGVPLSLEMWGAVGDQTSNDTESFVQRAWGDVGVKVNIHNVGSAKLNGSQAEGGIEETGRFDVVLEDWANGTDPDDSQMFMCREVPPFGLNIYQYCNPKLDAAENAGLAEYRQDRRKAHYDRIQEILAEDLPIMVLWFLQRQDVVNVNLQNYRPAHAVSPFWNAWQWEL